MLYYILMICPLILLLIFVYFYVKKENFENSQMTISTPTANTSKTISLQLTDEIAKVLEISRDRISNLKFEGDVKTNMLNIDFDILDGSVKYQREKSQSAASKQALELVTNDIFFVTINNQTIKLRKMVALTQDSAFYDPSIFFKNEGLKNIVSYSNNKYITVPNDEALTKFYTLDFDKDYKLKPNLK